MFMCLAIVCEWSSLAGNASTLVHSCANRISEEAVTKKLSPKWNTPILCFASLFRQSSVYCFYDPEYRALALGKVTALKETEFVKEVRFTALCKVRGSLLRIPLSRTVVRAGQLVCIPLL